MSLFTHHSDHTPYNFIETPIKINRKNLTLLEIARNRLSVFQTRLDVWQKACCFNPSNAKDHKDALTLNSKIFEKHLNPLMLVFIGRAIAILKKMGVCVVPQAFSGGGLIWLFKIL